MVPCPLRKRAFLFAIFIIKHYISDMKQLDPRAVWLFFLSGGTRILVFLLAAFSLIIQAYFEYKDTGEVVPLLLRLWWLIPILCMIALIIYAKFSYRFYKYELTDMGFKKESGIIWKQYVTIPYDRIQNVDIYRGIFARILGLSDLQIHTAGVGGVAMGEGRLPGLSVSDAEKMRDELLVRAKQSRNGQGL